ncbi:hypothetical protein BDZ89DRAFT_920049, partial [Hymenopellis radicata]
CAVCLGFHNNVRSCTKDTLWNGGPTLCTRSSSGIIVFRTGGRVCLNFQREFGCNHTNHPDRHVCT